MNTEAVARRLVQLCREGKFNEAQDELYAQDARSIEPDGVSGPLGSVHGMDAIREKGRRFEESIAQIHGVSCSDPLMADPFFSLVMGFDATYKEGGRRALLVSVPGEQHSFGVTMVAEFFRRAGWDAWTGAPRTRTRSGSTSSSRSSTGRSGASSRSAPTWTRTPPARPTRTAC